MFTATTQHVPSDTQNLLDRIEVAQKQIDGIKTQNVALMRERDLLKQRRMTPELYHPLQPDLPLTQLPQSMPNQHAPEPHDRTKWTSQTFAKAVEPKEKSETNSRFVLIVQPKESSEIGRAHV